MMEKVILAAGCFAGGFTFGVLVMSRFAGWIVGETLKRIREHRI